MPRLFTIEEAERLLPELEKAMKLVITVKAGYQEAESEFSAVTHRITMTGGSLVNRNKLIALRSRRDATAQRLKEAIEEVQQFGCLVKDLDLGLVDFPTLFRGEEVYLCWKLGETGIQFWHGVQEGFRGRKLIDQDFLDNHCGDLPQ